MRLAFNDAGEEIMARDSDIDLSRMQGTFVWVDAPAGWSKEKRYKLVDGSPVELNTAEFAPKRLLIHRIIPEAQDVTNADFTIIGLRKDSPHYDRGRKLYAEYLCPEDDRLVVRKTFSDVMESGLVTGIQVHFEWFCEDGTVGVEKTEVVKSFNKYEAATEMRKRRGRSIDYLVAGAAGTPIEPYLDFLFDRYYTEVEKFKSKDNTSLVAAIAGETDPTTLAYLAIEITSDAYGVMTVKDMILYQVS